MSSLSLSGPVARLDVPSADGRQLVAAGMIQPAGSAWPLLALHAGVDPRLGHYGAEPVGTLTGWDFAQVDEAGALVLKVVGEVFDDQRVPAGTYVCGLDTDFVETEAREHPDFPDGLMVVTAWRPIAVTLHLPGSLGQNAWPDLPPLTVEAAPR